MEQLPAGYELRALTADDAPALARMYVRNRAHLAPWEPVRPEDFYTVAGQVESVTAKLAAVEAGQMETWLLHHDVDVVGQVNVNNIIRAVLQSASIGYALDQDHLGRGLATRLVAHAARRADERGLHRLEAATIVDNVRSQGVLLRNGFVRYGTAERFLFIAGRWQDHHLYQRILNDREPGAPPA
jgi:ribosomal-protein-alanine N-acetyltransferase